MTCIFFSTSDYSETQMPLSAEVSRLWQLKALGDMSCFPSECAGQVIHTELRKNGRESANFTVQILQLMVDYVSACRK